MFDSPHRRFNPLTREWVLVSPHRAKRPWQGQVEKTPPENLPQYDPTCYLCPGNERAEGNTIRLTPPLLLSTTTSPPCCPMAAPAEPLTHPLFTADPESGLCRVICFSPRHDLSLPELSQAEVEAVIRTWTDETASLAACPEINYVQVFENKGAVMGCSNPHPHSQVWATAHIPNEPAKELASQGDYFRQHGRPLLLDYLAEEQKRAERILAANQHFTALLPFWAVWPFEILLVAHRPCAWLTDLSAAEQSALADLLKRVTARYDNLFEISFPYSMGFHQAPTDGQPHPEWVLHAHFYPPLLRSATVRKFMVGYEMLAQPQRDITPETAAARLRSLSDLHYKHS